MKLEMKQVNDKYGIYAKDKLLFVCNRAFNCDLVRMILEVDEEQEVFKIKEKVL